jgi:hypothetical protein
MGEVLNLQIEKQVQQQLAANKGLVINLKARGYPERLLRNWTDPNVIRTKIQRAYGAARACARIEKWKKR